MDALQPELYKSTERVLKSDPNPFVLKLMQSGLLTSEDSGFLNQASTGASFVKANTVLIEQGERPASTPVVMSGFVYRYRLLPNGKRQVLSILIPGDCCDIHGWSLGLSEHGTATITDSTIVWLSREIVDALTLERSRIARALWWSAHVDACILRTWLTSVGQRDAATGMAHLFCEMLLRLQTVGLAESNSCPMPCQQEMLGDILGITGVHVSRTVKQLRDRGLAYVNSRQLVVPNVQALRAFCEFDSTYLHIKIDPARPAA